MSRVSSYRIRRLLALIVALAIAAIVGVQAPKSTQSSVAPTEVGTSYSSTPALEGLSKLTIKGRAPLTGYTREQFGNGWATTNGCDTREIILRRDLKNVVLGSDNCSVQSGSLLDPYTGKTIAFTRGKSTSSAVQIDHVVALGDAWQKGAQNISSDMRKQLANDPLELLAVDGPANQQKGDGDAATWLPPNKAFRCYYVARQVAVKLKYNLWVTSAEHDAMSSILSTCKDQKLPD